MRANITQDYVMKLQNLDLFSRTAVYCGILRYTAVYCDILWHTVIYCGILRYTVVYCDILWYNVTSLGSCSHCPSTKNLYSCLPAGRSTMAVKSPWLRWMKRAPIHLPSSPHTHHTYNHTLPLTPLLLSHAPYPYRYPHPSTPYTSTPPSTHTPICHGYFCLPVVKTPTNIHLIPTTVPSEHDWYLTFSSFCEDVCVCVCVGGGVR